MKSFALSVAAVGMLALPVVGQNYAHFPANTPASGGSNSFPMNFSSTTGRFIQFLDPTNSTDLPTGTPLKITEVAFARSATNPTQFLCTGDFQMRMSALSAMSTFTSNSIPDPAFGSHLTGCPTELINSTSGFTYNAPTQNAWQDFGTTCDFGWDGRSIIVLEIRYRGQVTSLGFSCRSDGGMPRIWANSTSADNFVATSGSARRNLGLYTRLEYVKDHICLVPETTQLGASSPIALTGFSAGESYQIAASLGQTPFTIGNGMLCLTVDSVFQASVLIGGPIFGNYAGTIPASGNSGGTFAPPAIPALAGVCVYHAAVGLSGAGIAVTNTAGTMLVP